MQMTQLVSIVVPVYNAEQNLKKCIESLIQQSYKNIEIILVDDESTDSSWAICQEYEKKDKRVRAVQQENAGCGEARNTGIAIAKGDYVATVDSDDWVTVDYIEAMMTMAVKDPEIDYVKCGFYYASGDNITGTENWKYGIITGDNRMAYLQKGIFWIVVWNALYKRELAVKVKQPGLMGQDNYTSFFYMFYSHKVGVVDRPLYYYWNNPKGATGDPAKQVKRRLHLLTNTEMILRRIKDEKLVVTLDTMDWLRSKWAKEWYHYIRENKEIKNISVQECKKIINNLDFRRKISFVMLIFLRKLKGLYIKG